MNRRPSLRCLLALALLALVPARGQERLPGGAARFEADLIDLAERARQRTVLIYGVIGTGSGAVVDAQGTVVTNAHVVAVARYAVVQWADGRTTLMRRRGVDYGRDLAVLEPAEPLGRKTPAFALAARRPAEGAWVLAIGFPGGPRGNFDATVTLGTVVGENRVEGQPELMPLDYQGAIRTDVPLFSGNSGGPLVDLQGQLVGINGAVDVNAAASLALPIELVRQRLAELRNDLILLPGGRKLEPRENALLSRLYDALDPVARQLPERVAQASRALLQEELALPELPELPDLKELPGLRTRDPRVGLPGDRLARLARQGPRQAALDAALGREALDRGLALPLAGGGFATRIGPRHAVAKASLLGEGERVALASGGEARRVAVEEGDDLALLELPAGPGSAAPEVAPLRPVGSLVYGLGSGEILAAGVVSAGERGIGASLAARIQGGGQAGLERLLEGIAGLARRLGVKALEQLLEQLEQRREMQRGFTAGTPPRNYAGVLSIDAPLAPAAMGAPVVDRQGRLVGVAVGIAHHGTTYVVPMHRVMRAFGGVVGAPVLPERVGRARLF